MGFSLQTAAGRVFLWQRANQAIFLARNILLAWFISPAGYGDFTAGLNFAAYVGALATLEFRTAFFSKRELTAAEINTQWTAEVMLAAFNLLFGICVAPWVWGSRSPAIAWTMIGLLGVNLLDAAYTSHLYLTEKNLEFPFLAALRTLVNLVSFMICLGLAMAGWGWKALLIDRMAASALTALPLIRHARWRPQWHLDRPSLRWYWGFAGVLYLNGLLSKIVFGFDIFAINAKLGSEATGLYNMAMKWALIPMELGAGFLAVMALSFYSRQQTESAAAMGAAYTEVTFHIARFCMSIAVLMTLFMKEFFGFCYGPEWQQAPVIFVALLPYAVSRPLFQNVCQALQARQRLWTIFGAMTLQAVLTVVLVWWAAPRGLAAVATATGISVAIGYLLLEWQLWREIAHPLFRLFLMPTLLAAITLAAWLLADVAMGFVGKAVLAAVYVALAFWEWAQGRKRLTENTRMQGSATT